MSSSPTNWITRANIPLKHKSDASFFRKDKSKFAIAFNESTNELYAIRQNHKNDGLLQYSFTDDKWMTHKIDPPLNLERWNDYRDWSQPTAVINPRKKLLYLYDCGFIAKINLCDENNYTLEKIKHSALHIGDAPKATIINDEFHLIGNNIHWKFDEQLNQFVLLNSFTRFESDKDFNEDSNGDFNENSNGDSDSESNGYPTESDLYYKHIQNPGFVNVNDKQLLMFGGLNTYGASEFPEFYTNSIYECKINNGFEWTKLDIKTPFEEGMGIGCTTILNGKYVLIMGGECVVDGGGGGASNDIFIYSVSDRVFQKSKIKCPISGQFQIVSVNEKKKDEMLTFGFVRKLWKEFNINNQLFPPEYLVRIIITNIFDEFIHLFYSSFEGWDIKPGYHYKISVFDIIH